MDFGIAKKAAFVAGASDGLGLAIAEALAAEGVSLVLAARREERLRAEARRIADSSGVTVASVAGDLDQAAFITQAFEYARDIVGDVDILVTNNGGPRTGTFSELSDEDWAAGWERTMMSSIRMIRAFLPGMKDKGWGRVINVTSLTVRQPVPRLLLSNAYRAALTGMAKSLSEEVAPFGITINNVAPGYIATRRQVELAQDRAVRAGHSVDEENAALLRAIPMGRFGTPAEVGALACFLASQQAAYITGTTVLVDGGVVKST